MKRNRRGEKKERKTDRKKRKEERIRKTEKIVAKPFYWRQPACLAQITVCCHSLSCFACSSIHPSIHLSIRHPLICSVQPEMVVPTRESQQALHSVCLNPSPPPRPHPPPHPMLPLKNIYQDSNNQLIYLCPIVPLPPSSSSFIYQTDRMLCPSNLAVSESPARSALVSWLQDIVQ